jgi:hypothetical protein
VPSVEVFPHLILCKTLVVQVKLTLALCMFGLCFDLGLMHAIKPSWDISRYDVLIMGVFEHSCPRLRIQ